MALAETVSAITWENESLAAPSATCCQTPTIQTPFFRLKSLLDRVIGSILLIAATPIIALLVLAIKLSSKGPGIYCQKRVGHGGRHFMMYKLRTMRCDAEARTGPVWASAGVDPRVTPLGYWLRRLHLDELPQLYNIVRGEMSLVGPRPERPEFVGVLTSHIPGYLERLQVMPGITGLAQINLPPDTNLSSVRRKLILDREYIHTTSLLLDLRIILCTGLRLFGLRGGRAVWLFGLQRVGEMAADDSLAGPMNPATPQALGNEDLTARVESGERKQSDLAKASQSPAQDIVAVGR